MGVIALSITVSYTVLRLSYLLGDGLYYIHVILRPVSTVDMDVVITLFLCVFSTIFGK